MKKMRMAGEYGTAGELAAMVGMTVTASFGQQDEAHSDLLGVDLARSAGYNPCAAMKLWQRMGKKSGSFNGLTNFLSSHPHPEKRFDCIKKHLTAKYSTTCEN